MKKYEGYLGEIEELVDKNIMTEEHPYYDLYTYIKETYKEYIVKQKIHKAILEETTRIKDIFFKKAKDDSVEVDFTMLPFMKQEFEEIITKDYSQIEALINLLEPEMLNNFVNKIYDEIITERDIDNNRKIIEKTYWKIIEECRMALKGLKYKNQQFIDEYNGDINTQIITEFLKTLDENDIKAISVIQQEEEKRIKKTIECNKHIEIIKNNEKIVNKYLTEILNQKIKRIDEEIFRILGIEKSIYAYMLKENMIEINGKQETLNITIDRLSEIKISGDLFELLNIRCRLLLIKDHKEEKNTNIELDKNDIEKLEEIIKSYELEGIEPRYIEERLKEIQNEFKKIKEIQYNKESQELATIMHNQEIYKTTKLRKLEQDETNNIYALYVPTISGITSRGNAIYIINVLNNIQTDKKEIYEFLRNEKVSKLTSLEENYIWNVAAEKLSKYIQSETNRLSDNKVTFKQLKLIQEGEKNNGTL